MVRGSREEQGETARLKVNRVSCLKWWAGERFHPCLYFTCQIWAILYGCKEVVESSGVLRGNKSGPHTDAFLTDYCQILKPSSEACSPALLYLYLFTSAPASSRCLLLRFYYSNYGEAAFIMPHSPTPPRSQDWILRLCACFPPVHQQVHNKAPDHFSLSQTHRMRPNKLRSAITCSMQCSVHCDNSTCVCGSSSSYSLNNSCHIPDTLSITPVIIKNRPHQRYNTGNKTCSNLPTLIISLLNIPDVKVHFVSFAVCKKKL